MLAALDSASFGFGVAAGAVVLTALLWLLDSRGGIGDDWMGMFGVVCAGVAPVLGIIGAIVVAILT